MSILAGMVIAIGCVCYLRVGAVAGAIIFATGLLSVIFFKFKLFTGQAGKLVTKEITVF